MLRRLLLPLLLAALVSSGCSSLSGTNKGGYITGDGETTLWAPDDRGTPIELTGRTLEGKDVDLADFRGKPVVVNIWWSGCGPCRAEMPMLQQVARELADQVTFVGINTRDGSAENGLAFERSVGASYPSVYAPDGRALLAFPGLGPNLPQTIVLDAQGRMSGIIGGPIPSKLTLSQAIDCADASSAAQHCEVGS
jgi:thiol-disulfide isomerase/thioredoxin